MQETLQYILQETVRDILQEVLQETLHDMLQDILQETLHDILQDILQETLQENMQTLCKNICRHFAIKNADTLQEHLQTDVRSGSHHAGVGTKQLCAAADPRRLRLAPPPRFDAECGLTAS